MLTTAAAAARRCLEYLLFRTNRGRTFSLGNSASPDMTSRVTVNRAGGYLGSLRGWADKDGALQQIQMVWALSDCPPGVAPGTTVKAPAPVEVPMAVIGAEPEAPADAAPAAAEAEAPAAPEELAAPVAEAEPAAAPAAAAAATCPANLDLCDVTAADVAANACRAVAPFGAPQCMGGCCISSGKCHYGSCAANGLGKDAPLNCVGANGVHSALAMLGNKCAGLACKLAVPGCRTTLVGGSCAGTVVAVNAGEKLHGQGAAYVGQPCVETTPSGGLAPMPKLVDFGLPAREFVHATWKICDCAGAGDAPKPGLQLPGLKMPKLPGFGGKQGGDDEMQGPTRYQMMRDMVMGQMGLTRPDTSDPFAEFAAPVAGEAAAGEGAAAAPAEEAAAAAKAAVAEAEALPESAPVPMSVFPPGGGAAVEAAPEAAPEAEAAAAAAPEAAEPMLVEAPPAAAPAPEAAAPADVDAGPEEAPEDDGPVEFSEDGGAPPPWAADVPTDEEFSEAPAV